MKELYFILLLCAFYLLPLAAQHPPKHEVYAAWVTAVYGLDWPHIRATTPEGTREQQAELVEILDKLKAANFNMVLFQTRTHGDVLYQSAIKPCNSILTGKVGGNPGYDLLVFAIAECHKRRMECHAWMVTIPLGNRKHVTALGKESATERKPAICVPYERKYFLNPGHPRTKEYLMSLVRETVERYGVDSVHFDYLRYPKHALHFSGSYAYRKCDNGRDLAQWGRDNITEIVRYLYKEVKALKPQVKVSTYPVGECRDTSRYPPRGWDAFHTVYQDVQGWLGGGVQDQVYPVMYFRGGGFYPFTLNQQEQNDSRQIISGLGIYFLDPSGGDRAANEVERQIDFTRVHDLTDEGHYHAKYLTDNT